MAYTNQILAVVFLAVAIAPVLAEPQSEMFPNMTPECALVLPNLLEKCFTTVRVTPTDECCNDLKSANTTEVTCLCDNYIANPTTVNLTRPYTTGITTKCGVFDKYSCDGTSKGGETNKGEGPSSNSSSDSNGKDTSTSKVNGGRANMVAASVGVFGLLTSLLFAMF